MYFFILKKEDTNLENKMEMHAKRKKNTSNCKIES